MFRMIAGAGLLLLGTGAPAAPAAPIERGTVTRLRAQNEVLRERMGRLQLDLLIADVIATPTPAARLAGNARARAAGLRPQLVALSR